MSEIERHVRTVLAQPGRASRRAALAAVPFHLRERVKQEVIHRWNRRQGRNRRP